MRQVPQEEVPILFNYGLRAIDPDEWLRVQQFLDDDLEGWEVASDWVSPNARQALVSPRDISPSLQDLAEHAARVGDWVEEDSADPFLRRSTIDAESDLRVYLAWPPGQDRDVTVPLPVVISWRDERVVGFS